MTGLIFFPVVGFLVALAGVPLARRLAFRLDHVDVPGGRKAHERPTPLVGGLVIVPVFIILSVLSGASWRADWPFWAALLVIMGAGALDDRFAIRPRWKFLAQFTAAGLIVFAGGANVSCLGNVFGFGPFWLGFMHLPFSLIAAVLLINAVNLLDGLDGLAGGISWVALFWFLVACVLGHQAEHVPSLALMMGILAGFLVFNMRNPFRRRAAVFLGDAGSMALGVTLAWFGMTLGHEGAMEPMAVAWVLGLPIMDTCAQFARRVREGRHPFDADRDHFHHHFIKCGIDPARAVPIILGIVFIFGLIGVGGVAAHVPVPVLSILWIVTILAHMALSLRPERMRGMIARIFGRVSSDQA